MNHYINHHKACEYMTAILQANKHMYCSFVVLDEADIACHPFPELLRDSRGNRLIPGDQYVIVTCQNDYRYYINVTADSVVTMCAEVFNFIQNK